MKIEYRIATIDDLDLLVETRIKVLRAANKLSSNENMEEIISTSRQYYQDSFCNNSHVAYLVFDDNKVIGSGGVSFFQILPTYLNPTGKKSYIMNMYTKPEYRRKGIAFQMLDLLVNAALSRKINFIYLEATDIGKPLYTKYGFKDLDNEMNLIIEK